MNQKISVVILTKNEETNIRDCIVNAKEISDDIIAVDSGSTDGTCKISESLGAKVLYYKWIVYSQSANFGASYAKNDWILLLDADERITPELVYSVKNEELTSKSIYGFYRHPFIGTKRIKFGEWGVNKVYRLYNKNETKWDDTPIHSKLYTLSKKKILKGAMLHYTVSDLKQLRQSYDRYIKEIKRVTQTKKKVWIKKYSSSFFRFFKSYFFLLGFLDGKAGWYIACMSARYVYAKYSV